MAQLEPWHRGFCWWPDRRHSYAVKGNSNGRVGFSSCLIQSFLFSERFNIKGVIQQHILYMAHGFAFKTFKKWIGHTMTTLICDILI